MLANEDVCELNATCLYSQLEVKGGGALRENKQGLQGERWDSSNRE